MTSAGPHLAPAGPRAIRSRTAAGALLVTAGSVILMGIITAEALYPEVYTTFANEISDLGATRPPDSVIHQPSATIFNVTMLVAGACIALAGYLLGRARGARRVSISIAVLGIGIFGVGVFPGSYDAIHPLFALLAFVTAGVAAILSAHVQTAPFRYFSLAFGAITLAALVVGMIGEGTPVFDELGAGGVERWIAYPAVLWIVAFGAYLLPKPDH